MTRVWCDASGAFGTARLAVSHSLTGAGFPGADLSVWAPGSDPEEDEPALGGSEVTVERSGATLTGRIQLRATGSGDPGEGIDGPGDGDDPVTIADYQVTVADAGPTTTERQRDHVINNPQRSSERYRTLRTRTPIVGSGTLTVAGHDPVPLDNCDGEAVTEHTTITSPSTVILTGRYPLGFECVATGANGVAYLSLIGGDLTVFVVPDATGAVALGSVFAEATQRAVTAQVAMFDYETGEERGTGTLSAGVKTLQRQTLRYRDRQGSDTVRVEQVQLAGSLVFEGDHYQLDSCVGDRSRQHVIDHRRHALQRLAKSRR